ncbi:MAG: DNA alkylation repair protein [Oscillochloris sp.]|nr:DNA alkylation repair protein [Oscillochloris sp.]
MDLATAMRELEAAGTAQNRKVYGRHGVREPYFGVSYSALGALRKQIKRDQQLARELWATGNHDARILATMIADPKQCDEALLAGWAADIDNYVLSDALATVVAAAPDAYAIASRWVDRGGEWIASAGWNALAGGALGSELPDETWLTWLARIEREIHQAPNRVRYAMNNVLIAIGGRSDWLADHARAAAERIGTVHVDHGETGCKTPDAASMIGKMRDREAAKQEKLKAKH